ncbi:MAG TPA: sodium:proton antiporter [Actinomycetota bacterium]|nr:sodium:proton antiporter [Actinomycetota bacterium]
MNLFVALVVAVLFGTGASLLLKPDLFRVVAGLMLISNAASLTVIASGLRRGQPPIYPLVPGEPVADPLTQAMTLTALIIGFATTALLLAMAYRIYTTHRSVDLDDLSRSERSAEEELERGTAVEQVEPEEAEAEQETAGTPR